MKEVDKMKIVNLDVALDENGKFIKATDAILGKDYYCPDCNQIVHIRALESKTVTPHFYHLVKGDCNGESAIHKYWKSTLFNVGDVVNIYPVGQVMITHKKEEHRFTNINGKTYQPDIIVKTDNEKFRYLFIEIFNTSKKKVDEYLDIWKEKQFGVVEIDVKKMTIGKTCKDFSLLYNPYAKNITPAYMYVKYIGKHNKEIYCRNNVNITAMKRFKDRLVATMVDYESYPCDMSKQRVDEDTRKLIKDIHTQIASEYGVFAKFVKLINKARLSIELKKIFYEDGYYTYKNVDGEFIKEYEKTGGCKHGSNRNYKS